MSKRLRSDVESIDELLPLVQLGGEGHSSRGGVSGGRGAHAGGLCTRTLPCKGPPGTPDKAQEAGEAKDTKAVTGSSFHLMYCKRNHSFGINYKAQGKQFLSICKKA
jgi:hypothetical protein